MAAVSRRKGTGFYLIFTVLKMLMQSKRMCKKPEVTFAEFGVIKKTSFENKCKKQEMNILDYKYQIRL